MTIAKKNEKPSLKFYIKNKKTVLAIEMLLYLFAAFYIVCCILRFFTPQYSYQFMAADVNFAGAFFRFLSSAGLLLVILSVFCGDKSINCFLYYVTFPAYLLSLLFFGNYFSMDSSVFKVNVSEVFLKSQYFLELILFIVVIILQVLSESIELKPSKKGVLRFLLVQIGLIPFNIFNRFESVNIPDFFRARNFGIWHLLAVVLGLILVFSVYFALRKKDKETIWEILFIISLIMIAQYFTKYSIVMSISYKGTDKLWASLPLYVCDWGTLLVPLAIKSRNKFLLHILFLINSVGALSIFVYLEIYEAFFFTYNYIYFVLMHGMLYILSISPVLFKLVKVDFKKYFLPVAGFLTGMLIVAVIANSLTSDLLILLPDGNYAWFMPNYSFMQFPPMQLFDFGPGQNLFGIEFNIKYCLFITAFYFVIIFAHFGLYLMFKQINKRIQKNKTAVQVSSLKSY